MRIAIIRSAHHRDSDLHRLAVAADRRDIAGASNYRRDGIIDPDFEAALIDHEASGAEQPAAHVCRAKDDAS
jgi:hypothetical protein